MRHGEQSSTRIQSNLWRTTLTLAARISTFAKILMVMRRKETKQYGTKQTIEGIYHAGQRVLVIEDLISSGASILETVLDLEISGLSITEAIVFIDREQTGIEYMREYNICANSVLKLTDVMQALLKDGYLMHNEVGTATEWICANAVSLNVAIQNEVEVAKATISASKGPSHKNLGFAEHFATGSSCLRSSGYAQDAC